MKYEYVSPASNRALWCSMTGIYLRYNKLSKPRAMIIVIMKMKQPSIIVKFSSLMTVNAVRIMPINIIVTETVTWS